MEALRSEIFALTEKEHCTDPKQWRISPLGSKACGGPEAYIAYPIKLENEILPKIKEYNALQSAFNRKYKVVSDCAMVMPPTEIKCENGKAVLVSGEFLIQ